MEINKTKTLPNVYKCSLEKKKWYVKIIGLLIYIIVGIYVNIVYFVLFFSGFLQNPGLQYIRATKRIMQYLWRTIKFKLTFCGNLKLLIRYTNLD